MKDPLLSLDKIIHHPAISFHTAVTPLPVSGDQPAANVHYSDIARPFVAWTMLLAVALAGLGCRFLERSSSPELAAPDEQKLLQEKLDHAGLTQRWQAKLPLNRKQQLQRLFLKDGQLYALTNWNSLYALAATEGTITWHNRLVEGMQTCSDVSYYNDRLMFTLGTEFVEIRRSDGETMRRVDLGFSTTTSPARTEDYLFVGGADRVFYCLNLSNVVPIWQSVCPAIPTGNVVVARNRVYFVCRDGAVEACALDRPERYWRQETAGSVPGIVVDNDECYIPSADTALYALRTDSGGPLWFKPGRHLLGGALTERPDLTAQAVYQPIDNAALVCLNRSDGSVRWHLDDGRCLLAENGPKTYALTHNNELAVMNNKTGTRELSFYLPDYTICARNTETSMLFLATPDGRILALAPEGSSSK